MKRLQDMAAILSLVGKDMPQIRGFLIATAVMEGICSSREEAKALVLTMY